MSLRTYSGEQLTVLGQLDVVVQSGDRCATLPLQAMAPAYWAVTGSSTSDWTGRRFITFR